MSSGAQSNCIFCRLVAGEISCREAHSGTLTYAFHDLAPVAPVHVLVVPRQHIVDASQLGTEDGPLLAEMVVVARTVAEQAGLGSGYRLVFNTGTDAGAEVPHLHMHVLGGRQLGWPPG